MQQNDLPPLYNPPMSQEDKAVAAGFILHYRRQVLAAINTLANPVVDQIVNWPGPTRSYYVAAEAYTRYQLWLLGYPVAKDQMWEG